MENSLSNTIAQLQEHLPGLESAKSFHEIVVFLIASVQNNKTAEFESFFAFLEQQIIFSEPQERDEIIVGLLEDLKNESSLRDLDYVIFENWLGPETHIAWRWLEKKWQGKKSLVDRVSVIHRRGR